MDFSSNSAVAALYLLPSISRLHVIRVAAEEIVAASRLPGGGSRVCRKRSVGNFAAGEIVSERKKTQALYFNVRVQTLFRQ